MKIRPAGAEFFDADRRTDMTKLKAAFRNFANGPKKWRIWCVTKRLLALEGLCYIELINLICEIRNTKFRHRNTGRNKSYDKQPNLVIISLQLTNPTVRRP